MMYPLFPALPGLGYSNYKRPTWSTTVSAHVSGDEVRAANMAYPWYEFELAIPDYLPDSDDPASDLKTLMGFYLRCQGQFGAFRYIDPSDNAISGQELGKGDGQTVSFPVLRALGGWTEPVGYVEAMTKVTVGGVDQAAGWAVTDSRTGHNLLTFSVAPAAGAIVTADFSFSFLCRFTEDQQEFEQQMKNYWLNKSIKFKSVKRP